MNVVVSEKQQELLADLEGLPEEYYPFLIQMIRSYRDSVLLQPAAEMVLAPLKEDPPNQIIVDLSAVSYFGSAFITFLLRCHHLLNSRGSELVLAGVNPNIRELLRITNLEMYWALYDTAEEAITALGGSD